uniref:Conserved plasma membrane protein n=1 Tax=Panagrellus redivivus TaxID=6233 RepID=A0A7E4VH81_PANRE
MAKFEVQVRSCFCCGLSIGTVFIGLYTLLVFSLLTGLAAWGLSDTNQNGDKSHFTSCELEAQGKINADNRKLVLHNGHQTVIIEDSTSYHCSFGLYTEELKYSAPSRYSTLWFDIILYIGIVVASLILLAGLAIYSEWLLVPWIVLMIIEVIRGFISVFMIFWLSYGNLARLATAIFFLGVQFLHISLIVLVIAKFQRMHNRNTGVVVDADKQYEVQRPYPTATLPSNYTATAYSPQVGRHAQPDPYAAGAYSDYSPAQNDPRYYDNGYRQPPPNSVRY